MEGKNVKVELENSERNNSNILEMSEEVLRVPGESSVEEDDDEEYSEEEPEEEPEEYYEDDEDWEAEAGGSDQLPLGGLYGLFKDVAHQKDTKKVSNLTKEELGVWDLSVRDCERIALIAETFHHPGVAKFFQKQSRVITDTAMSKNGWFTELFITSKKFASRESGSSISNLPQFNKKSKWRMFSEKENQQNQE